MDAIIWFIIACTMFMMFVQALIGRRGDLALMCYSGATIFALYKLFAILNAIVH